MQSASFELTGLALFALLSVLPGVPAIIILLRLLANRDEVICRKRTIRFLGAVAFAMSVYGLVVVDAYVVEPNWPRVERVELRGRVAEPLTILHISDLHIEKKLSRRDEWLIENAARLHPDVIVLTGDIHQVDNVEAESTRRVLSSMQARLGVFACVGYDNTMLLKGVAPQVRVLSNESVILQSGASRVGIAGLLPVDGREDAYKGISDCEYRIVINHTPDLADEAARHGADLYLCGHTHGGQVRIPLWGAIITNSDSGKRYEAGMYRSGKTAIHTSRGLGLEPRPAPQVRFFCRPEITLISVVPDGQ